MVHPRVCGETATTPKEWSRSKGPSPRVRGNRRRVLVECPQGGSIPACAGKPEGIKGQRPGSQVHPRVCGETAWPAASNPARMGPSPRVRGNLIDRVSSVLRTRSIPACAGKPAPPGCRCDRSEVHPRVCGETESGRPFNWYWSGPSPRVRGNRQDADQGAGPRGSIPACAGKPASMLCSPCRGMVHPRVCGETGRSRHHHHLHAGPSPRVRGNRTEARRIGGVEGSIPACAGKPTSTIRGCGRARVHPRVCGETSLLPNKRWANGGPSPRVRGNRDHGIWS